MKYNQSLNLKEVCRMKQYVCGVCGYVYEGADAPDKCPQCGAAKEMFEPEDSQPGAPA